MNYELYGAVYSSAAPCRPRIMLRRPSRSRVYPARHRRIICEHSSSPASVASTLQTARIEPFPLPTSPFPQVFDLLRGIRPPLECQIEAALQGLELDAELPGRGGA